MIQKKSVSWENSDGTVQTIKTSETEEPGSVCENR